MMRVWKGILGLLLGLALSTGVARATVITYEVANIAGNTFEYSYSVANDSLAVEIAEFTVFFDLGLFENVTVATAPPDWDPIAIQPDPGLPDDGFYDVLALAAGIAPGASLGGFSVQADYLGAGLPGSQFFEIRDALTFDLLDTGFTELAGQVAVSEPASLGLMVLGLLGLAGLARQRRA